jgi:legumain
MKAKGMYSELVFYIEACESGSMFPNLKADSGVYAMTASNEKVSSWAAYCGEHSTVQGLRVNQCLGDLFSVNWMNDTETHLPSV